MVFTDGREYRRGDDVERGVSNGVNIDSHNYCFLNYHVMNLLKSNALTEDKFARKFLQYLIDQ